MILDRGRVGRLGVDILEFAFGLSAWPKFASLKIQCDVQEISLLKEDIYGNI